MKIIYRSNPKMKYITLIMAFAIFASGVHGQTQKAKKKPIIKEQTSFSSEGKISKPVKIPENVLKQLGEYDDRQLEQCQQDEFSRKANAAEHFAASKINLNGDQWLDLIVQAQTHCFMGAHNTTFWIFTGKSETTYELTFDIAVDFLEILKTSTKGYRDIETASHTAVELYSVRWKFDSQKYQKSECKVRDSETEKMRKIKCDF